MRPREDEVGRPREGDEARSKGGLRGWTRLHAVVLQSEAIRSNPKQSEAIHKQFTSNLACMMSRCETPASMSLTRSRWRRS